MLVVNLFGGPGTGKSTTASLVFGILKSNGVNAELVHEYAKDLVWEERHKALRVQPYIFGKQFYHVERLRGAVDVAVTDSPILLSGVIYGAEHTTRLFKEFVLDEFINQQGLNFFLVRTAAHPYKEAGRNQTQREAEQVDFKIRAVLGRYHIPFTLVEVGPDTASTIAEAVEARLIFRSRPRLADA